MSNEFGRGMKVKVCLCGGPDFSSRLPFIKVLATNGYNVTAIGSHKAEEDKFIKYSIPYRSYPLNRRFSVLDDIRSFLTLYSIFKREKSIIVHAFDTKPTILGRIAAKLAGVPIIIGTIPGMGSLFSDDTLINKILRFFYIISQKVACGMSDLTIFQNYDDLNFFITKKIVSSSKATTIKGSGVDVEEFSPKNLRSEKVEKTKIELGFDPNGIKIFMISRLIKYKGVKEYLEAAKILKSKYRNIDFFLIGPVDDTIAAFSLEEVKKYAGIVKYIGPRDDIPEILFFADIVVLPTYYREGIPRILLEAASMGKPIVTTDIPGCREIVEDGVNGFLVPPKNSKALVEAIGKLILDENLRKQMGEASRKKVLEEFSLNIVFEQTLNAYKKLFKNKSL